MKRTLHAVAAFAVLACACEERRRTVDITFGEDLEGLSGFECLQENAPGNPPLIQRAVSGETILPVNLVVDLISMGDGIPGCRPAQIRSWCATHDCRPSKGRRVIQPLDLSGIAPSQPDALQQVLQRLDALDGVRIFDDVPGGKAILLRVVGTLESESALEQTDSAGRYVVFDTAGLLGAAYSCPVVLSAASGELFLGFDALDNRCEAGVIIAAGAF